MRFLKWLFSNSTPKINPKVRITKNMVVYGMYGGVQGFLSKGTVGELLIDSGDTKCACVIKTDKFPWHGIDKEDIEILEAE